jgi:hypothetical protein
MGNFERPRPRIRWIPDDECGHLVITCGCLTGMIEDRLFGMIDCHVFHAEQELCSFEADGLQEARELLVQMTRCFCAGLQDGHNEQCELCGSGSPGASE